VRLTPRTFFWLLQRSVISAFDDNCLSIAKGAAYSALLSFFPVLTSAAAILVQTRAQFVSDMLEQALQEIVPPGSEDLVLQQLKVTGSRPIILLIVAAVISLWAASGVVKSLIEGFQAAYRVPRDRGILQGSVVAIALVLLAAIPLLAASFLILFGGQIERLALHWMKVDPIWTPLAWVWELLSRLARYGLAFITTVTVTALLYYFGPNRPQRWRYVWPGAILSTTLWLGATAGFAWYVRNIGNYNVMYGSIGAGIALLVWMYVLAIIALIGCEFNAEWERAASRAA
jgi:membrane protein